MLKFPQKCLKIETFNKHYLQPIVSQIGPIIKGYNFFRLEITSAQQRFKKKKI